MRELDDLCPSRRTLLQVLAGAVLLPGVLAACSSGDEVGSAAGGNDGGRATVPTSEVPVGHARVVNTGGDPVVVAQPTAGRFVAFTAVCTHQGTTVETGDGLTLTCPNHGSQFDAADGSVVHGPAKAPLAAVAVSQQGANLVFG